MRILLLGLIFFTSLFGLDITQKETPIFKEILFSDKISNISEAIENPNKFRKIKRFRHLFHNKKYNTAWLKIPLINSSSKTLEKIFVTRWERIELNLFWVKENEVIHKENILNTNYIKYSSSIKFLPNEKVELYIQTKNEKALDQFNYMYIVDKNFIKDFLISKIRLYHNGLFLGILLTMMMYSYFMFFSIKVKAYLYLGFYQTWVIIVTSSIYQYMFVFLENYPNIAFVFLKVLLPYSMIFFSIVFAKEFLNTKDKMPKLNTLLNITLVVLIPLSFFPGVINYTAFLPIIYVYAGFYAFLRGDFSALFFALGFLGFSKFSILLNLSRIFEWNIYFEFIYARQIFTSIESFALCMALYLKLKEIIKEKNLAEQKSIKHEKMMLEQSRFASMGEMIASIAHQWRQPLNHLSLILANIQLAFDSGKLDKKYMNEKTDEAKKQLKYMSITIKDFSNYFAKKGEIEKFYLKEACNYSIELVESRMKKEAIKINISCKNDFVHLNYKNELIQVLTIILNNAIDALRLNNVEDRKIFIDINSNVISIKDNAGGVPSHILSKIFDPYFSTKDKKFGRGLGLYTAKMIIENLIKSTIKVENGDDGAIFMIILSMKENNITLE